MLIGRIKRAGADMDKPTGYLKRKWKRWLRRWIKQLAAGGAE